MRVALVVLLLSACGDNVTVPAGIRNGSRLSAVWYAAGDAGVFRFWHDAKLDLDCSFQVATDGRYRCLPNDSSTGFGDASCQKPIATVMPCETAPPYVHGPLEPLAACPTDRGVGAYAMGDVTANNYFYDDGTSCRLGNNGSGGVLHALSKVSVDDFIAAELVRDHTGAPIESYAFHADDGAIQNESGWDTARDIECGIGDDPRCTPLEIALHYDDLWSDPSCTGTHAAVDLGRVRPCGRPTAVLDYTAAGAQTFFEIGAALPMAYQGSAGACAPAQALPGDVFYVVGPPIPDVRFPVASTVEDGTGRLRTRRYQQATGAPLELAFGFFDTTFNETCTPQPFTDGTTRCVPQSAPMGGGLYADSACTTPIAQLNVAHAAAILVAHSDEACGGTVRYESFAVGAPYTGAIFANGNGCKPYARDSAVTYVNVGDAIELAQLDER